MSEDNENEISDFVALNGAFSDDSEPKLIAWYMFANNFCLYCGYKEGVNYLKQKFFCKYCNVIISARSSSG